MKQAVLLGLLFCTGCALANDPTPACLDSLVTSASLSPLSGKINLGRGKHAFEVLANGDYPTEEEKRLIAIWATERDKCMQQGEAIRANMNPVFVSLFNASHTKITALTADLYASRLTYGEFAQQREGVIANFRSALAAAANQMDQQRSAAVAEHERARQQAITGILANQKPYQPPQLQPYQIPIPIRTTCRPIGNEVVCETR